MKAGVQALMLTVALVVGMFLGGVFEHKEMQDRATLFPVNTDQGVVVVVEYLGENYIVGSVNEEGQAQLRTEAVLTFLMMHAKDKGIRDAAKSVGFTGLTPITVRTDSSDAP